MNTNKQRQGIFKCSGPPPRSSMVIVFLRWCPCSNANRCPRRCGKNRGETETGSVETGAMINRQRLTIFIVVTALSLPAYADHASDAYKHGVRAERQSDYDAAYTYFQAGSHVR